MMTCITRPTLADLWRAALARLESQGAADAPALARSLAVAALMGRPAEASGVRVERDGDAVLMVDPAPARPSARTTPANHRCQLMARVST